jgi:hypothetical protein
MPADWATISSLATAGGTLVLAVATFASVRSANRAARAAEESLLDGLRPLLVNSRIQDPPEKISFSDRHWVRVPGGHGAVEANDDAVYLAIALRNVGRGMAVLQGWAAQPSLVWSPQQPDHYPLDEFRRLTRDLYIPAGDFGFWQGAIRDTGDPLFSHLRDACLGDDGLTIEILYGDSDGGQREISRFGMIPHKDPDSGDRTWFAVTARHWSLDRPDPR